MSYSNGIQTTYFTLAAAIDTAAVTSTWPSLESAQGGGLTGRITGCAVLCTVQLTGAGPSVLSIGDGTDANAYGTISVPDTAAGALAAITYTDGPTVDSTNGLSRIPADSLIVVTSDGGHTAGDGDIYLTVEWS